MKTHTIKTPIAELLIVELPETGSTFDVLTALNSETEGYTLLGKPDEIREKDAKDLVEIKDKMEREMGKPIIFYKDYNDDSKYYFRSVSSLLSLLETEIYWENPLGKKDDVELVASKKHEIVGKYLIGLWHQAEQKTFDRNRTIIFKKNKQ